jgi:nicotinamidase-related amidase
MGPHSRCCRSEWLRSTYAADPERGAAGEASHLLCAHRRYRPGDYETWKYIAPIQKAAWAHKSFEYGTWGGEFRAEFEPKPAEIVVSEHWCSSGFANTDLDLQLKKHGIHQLVIIGLIAHTCIEATVRFAAELGYEVTVVKDATADYSHKEMQAALDINIPNYASAIVTTQEVVASISALWNGPHSARRLFRNFELIEQPTQDARDYRVRDLVLLHCTSLVMALGCRNGMSAFTESFGG